MLHVVVIFLLRLVTALGRAVDVTGPLSRPSHSYRSLSVTDLPKRLKLKSLKFFHRPTSSSVLMIVTCNEHRGILFFFLLLYFKIVRGCEGLKKPARS